MPQLLSPPATLRARVRDSILVRPLLFVVGGLVLAVLVLAADRALGPGPVPAVLRFAPETARPLLTTLAGATLTLAGITFWVRAASVQLASSQYSPRVVHGFLQDWFQQSMMGLLVGIFACIVAVLRVVPAPGAPAADPPHLAVLLSVVLSGGSVLAVLVAIRNSVRSMQAGELARRITDRTVLEVARAYPLGLAGGRGSLQLGHRAPAGRGQVVRAASSGWVQAVDEDAALAPVPPGGTVRFEVRPGLFVVRGRPLVTLWTPDPLPDAEVRRIRQAVELGRSQRSSHQVQDGIHQLVDVAMGSLSHASDTASAYEVIVHIELLLRELMHRAIPPSASSDAEGRWVMRPRAYTFADYVADAYDRLRLAAAPHPTVATALLESLGDMIADLEAAAGGEAVGAERAAALRRQGRLLLSACRHQDHVAEDLALLAEVAARHGIPDVEAP